MELINIIIQGIIAGIILTVSFGAGFFALIQTSITKGIRKGILIAVGNIISDTLFIGMAVFATSFISEELVKYSKQVKIAGLIAFLILGLRTIVKSSKVKTTTETGEKKAIYYVSKGFLLNTVNPLVLLSWIGISAYLESTLLYGLPELALFFASVLVSVFSTQLAICYSSHKIKNYLSEKFIHRVNILVGVIFICMGFIIYFSNGSTQQGMEKAQQFLGK